MDKPTSILLSKPQSDILDSLTTQLLQIQEAEKAVKESIHGLTDLVRAFNGLPEGKATVSRGPEGWVLQVAGEDSADSSGGGKESDEERV